MRVEFLGGPLDGLSREFGARPPLTVVCEMPRVADETCAQFREAATELPDSMNDHPIGRYGADLHRNALIYRWKGEY